MGKASKFFPLLLRFTKAHHKITSSRPGLGKLHKMLVFPFNISAKVEANDVKFGMQLGFAKARGKITFTNSKHVRRFGKLLKFGVPFNISAMAEASEFKFGTQLRFAQADRKIPPRGNSEPY